MIWRRAFLLLALSLSVGQSLLAQPGGQTWELASCRKGLALPGGGKLASLRVNEKNKELPLLLHIEDPRAKKVWEFPLLDQDGNACGSVLNMAWLNEDTLGLECHINPSLSNYLLVDAVSGKCRKNFYGYNFCWSPDGKVLAHVGAITHFAGAEYKSEYLQFNDKTVYPRPGKSLSGKKSIHSFSGAFIWSGDSKKVAFFDFVDEGEKDARPPSLVVVSLDGSVTRKPLALSHSENAQIHWSPDARSITVETATKRQLRFKLPL